AQAAAAGLSVSYTQSSGTLSITGSASTATYQTILEGVQYNDTSASPTTTNRTVTVTVSDGTVTSVSHSDTITVTAVNNAPVITSNPTQVGTVAENGLQVATGQLTASDADAGDPQIWTIQGGQR